MACNRLSFIADDDIGQLKKLRILKLNGNGIASLPSTIDQCTQLEHLILSENKLTELPTALAECSNLKVVRLQHSNALQLLPRLSDTIEAFDVSINNNLNMIPSDVRDNASVIMWILSLQINKRNEIKQIENIARDAMKRLKESEDAIRATGRKSCVLSRRKSSSSKLTLIRQVHV